MTIPRLCAQAILLGVSVSQAGAVQQSQREPGLDFMLPVPAGTAVVGRTAKELHATLEELHPTNTTARIKDGRRLMSALGPATMQIEPFRMSRNLITNEQYEIFVRATGHRFPFDWWRDSFPEDYDKRLTEINKTYKDLSPSDRPIEYWKENWDKENLPWKIPTYKDESMARYPVVYVSWKDAVAFAAWAGMRLPTESEWLYAAHGGTPQNFVWGNELEKLPVERGSRHDKPQPVGAHGDKTQGPFGHQDMCLHVFEWVGDPGFFAFDQDAFERERQKFIKDSLWRKLEKKGAPVNDVLHFTPPWRGPTRVSKGGWYGSQKEQLLLDLRAPQGGHQVRSALGFRVAKSTHPARDIALSQIRLDYDMSYFGEGREPNLNDQVGVERYHHTDTGLIKGYDALSLVPINHLGNDKKNSTKDKFGKNSQLSPIVVATVVTTKDLTEPKLKAGTYTVLYRASGTPRDLQGVWKDARKAVAKAKRDAKKKKKESETSSEKDGKWKSVIRKYGLEPEDVEANPSPQYIRLNPGKFQIPLDERLYLFRSNDGYVASLPANVGITSKKGYKLGDADVQITPGKADSDEVDDARFIFGVPPQEGARNGQVFVFTMNLKLDWN